ncbi:Yhc1p [Cyberlindnera jadinii NRRL Y-1542]|uniref:Zf-U1-domain-containing protein n=1 Tax=Cyberlindnera jadinii (strain ATCC 18201 / CBS 1600 / BCRC 20928 / JCM 3617 / NBRC 0987 / NRRL Y-1542) TaxID=983966 RepID=A0A1E4S6V3_CYBJN|nr:zf-U1-domain-containing protein [Cyberlindnera jadinii NRRL Y-1542]ODV75122.1 zf-U1-domain-containing protein [Cyberlindnera jadinii NRRL Y-1542]
MPRFYCDYCNSYLTHDAASVRKNHLTGKNHVKLVCDYYEEKAKELGIWRENDMPFELTTENLYRGIPGSSSKQTLDLYRMSDMKTLPPPPTISGLPQPPPKVLHDSVQEKRQLLGNILQTIGET